MVRQKLRVEGSLMLFHVAPHSGKTCGRIRTGPKLDRTKYPNQKHRGALMWAVTMASPGLRSI